MTRNILGEAILRKLRELTDAGFLRGSCVEIAHEITDVAMALLPSDTNPPISRVEDDVNAVRERLLSSCE